MAGENPTSGSASADPSTTPSTHSIRLLFDAWAGSPNPRILLRGSQWKPTKTHGTPSFSHTYEEPAEPSESSSHSGCKEQRKHCPTPLPTSLRRSMPHHSHTDRRLAAVASVHGPVGRRTATGSAGPSGRNRQNFQQLHVEGGTPSFPLLFAGPPVRNEGTILSGEPLFQFSVRPVSLAV